ncbi:hypothetical protein QDX91_004445 [Salmonella enterica]|nr:hypothetical protein [Salmonella enterica subsp. enterica]EEE4266499.1 hypothetical protein [Salmonella enterica subsp. enterica serovar Sandiego]EJW2129016.1 hypothetical protein [Salmonella enterica]EKT1704948.1 hypothetical protein [Salmonella enterica]ELC6907237.1 hypothetical protein [Salmonella enterica]
MSPQEKINRAMNEYAATALDAWHAEHPFKYFLYQIFGMFEQEFMKFTTQDGQLDLLANALMDNEQLRKDLGLKALVWGEDNERKVGMARFNDGTVALFIMNSGRHELICGSELGCGGEGLWNTLQYGFEHSWEGEGDLAVRVMEEAERAFNDNGDEIMAGLQAAITFGEGRFGRDGGRISQEVLEGLNDMRSLYLDGPVGWSGNRDLSVLGSMPEFSDLASGIAGRLVERAENGVYEVGSLQGINLGFGGGTGKEWIGFNRVGDTLIFDSPRGNGTLYIRRDKDHMYVHKVKGDTLRMDLKVPCSITEFEIVDADIDALKLRYNMAQLNHLEAAKLALGSVLKRERLSDNGSLVEAKRCFDDLREWIAGGRDPKATLNIPEPFDKDGKGAGQDSYWAGIAVEAVAKAIWKELLPGGVGTDAVAKFAILSR